MYYYKVIYSLKMYYYKVIYRVVPLEANNLWELYTVVPKEAQREASQAMQNLWVLLFILKQKEKV